MYMFKGRRSAVGGVVDCCCRGASLICDGAQLFLSHGAHLCAVVLSPLRKPLSGYVALTLGFSLVIAACSLSALCNDDPSSDIPDEIRYACIGNVGCAAVSTVFALYLQHRLAAKGFEGVHDEESVETLAQRPREVILYDVAFLAHAMCLVASCILGCIGVHWYMVWDSVMPDASALMASLFLIVYCAAAFLYFSVWFCVVTCCGLAMEARGFSKHAPEPQRATYGTLGPQRVRTGTLGPPTAPWAAGAPQLQVTILAAGRPPTATEAPRLAAPPAPWFSAALPAAPLLL